jgi:hypothetical protein
MLVFYSSASVDKIAAYCYKMYVTDRMVLTEQRVKLRIYLLTPINVNNSKQ